MRIAGYIEDQDLKITIFQYEGKYSVQFETPHNAQIFKLRNHDGLSSLDDVRSFIDENFILSVKERMISMHTQVIARYIQILDSADGEESFDEII